MFDKYQCGIYCILNLLDGKQYVGSTKNFNNRFKEHKSRLRNNKHYSKHLQSAYNKYGESNFEFKKLVICEIKDLLIYEQAFMDYYKSYEPENGYNLRKKAESNLGITTSQKGIKRTEAQKEHLRKINLGKKASPEAIEKMRIASTGRKHTQEAKDKISKNNRENHLGKKLKPESIEKREKTRKAKLDYMRANNIPTPGTGNKLSQESINKRTRNQRIARIEACLRGEQYGKKKNLNISIEQMREIQDMLQNTNFNI